MGRIAITGVGSINALGVGVDRFDEGLRQGRCAIGSLTALPNLGFRSDRVAEVEPLQLPEWVPRHVVRRASRSTRLALLAAAEASQAASLAPDDVRAAAVIVGTSTGGMSRGEANYQGVLTGTRAPRLSSWLEAPLAAPTDSVAQVLGCGGPRLTVSTACSSGANALGLGADWIRLGRARVVLCGGVDSLCLVTYSGFDALQALDRVACRPFDRDRAGLTLGEGAAFFVLEDWDAARARGARIRAELVSYGVTADAHHLTQPRPDGAGAVRAIRLALEAGDVATEEIDYVNAHGTGTPLNDLVETRAIKTVLGERAYDVPVSSTKSMVGHCLAAAGAVEVLACLLAIWGQYVPPTANLHTVDPECDLDYVPREARAAAIRTALSNSYGFGGNNTAVIVRAADG